MTDAPGAAGADGPGTAFDEAIRQQHLTMRTRIAEGMPRAGWKICVNDGRMQKKLGLAASFVGFLDGSRALRDGDDWPVEEGSVLGVEPEFALLFAHSLAPDADADAIRRAIGGAAPALEVVDWRGASLSLDALASSSSFHAGFVVGEMRPFEAVPVIAGACPQLRRGDEVLGLPDPALVPRDLTTLVAHVAAFLARYGQSIEAGDWLLCGACTNPARVGIGDAIDADFSTLGSVRVRFIG